MRLLRVTAGPAGARADQMELAVTLSSALFQLVVLGAAGSGRGWRDDRAEDRAGSFFASPDAQHISEKRECTT